MIRLEGNVRRGPTATILVDGEALVVHRGESLAAALLACGRRTLRHSPKRGEPRGMFCGMGVCYECLVTVDGRPNVRGCMTPVEEGMRVETSSRRDRLV